MNRFESASFLQKTKIFFKTPTFSIQNCTLKFLNIIFDFSEFKASLGEAFKSKSGSLSFIVFFLKKKKSMLLYS